MRILDTASSQHLTLPASGVIRIYLCGVTVYDDSHIGHARTVIIFDVLRRYLESLDRRVTLVQNFTDVDDKIMARARDEGVTAPQLSSRYIRNYHRDFGALNILPASMYPRATEHIHDIISLISDLIEKKAAYVTPKGVYFAVSGFDKYGQLSGKQTDELEAGARIEVDEDKRDPLDFALWKLADGDPSWDSPWGRGRPGWHIECSAMSLRYLGSGFEVHGGGRDLIFPHHENEIAQSESHTGEQLAKIWMHVGMVTINGEKMSKSLGNIRSVRHVLDGWGPNVIRIFCLSGHYSKPIDYSESLLRESLVKWRQVETAYYELVHAPDLDGMHDTSDIILQTRSAFRDSMEDNLNTHEALSAFFSMVRRVNAMAGSTLTRSAAGPLLQAMRDIMDVLGLVIPPLSPEEARRINDMIQQRDSLRDAKQYKQADAIRDEIAALNVELLDHKSYTSWVKKEEIKAR